MFCPEIRLVGLTGCAGRGCVYYLPEIEACSKALDIKARLSILTQEEKAALTTIRKGKK